MTQAIGDNTFKTSQPFQEGVLNYNDVEFPFQTTVNIVQVPVYTTSGRTVKYIRYTVTAEAVLSAADCQDQNSSDYTTDRNIGNVREALSLEDKTLILSGFGLGEDLNIVNRVFSGRTRRDVIYGPKPRILEYELLAGSHASKVRWTVEFALSPCRQDRGAYTNPIAEWEYTIAWSINETGFTTRTISGSYEIAGSQTTAIWTKELGYSDRRRAEITADNFREQTMRRFPVPAVNFRRTTQSFTLSEDRRTMTFNIVDQEHESENAYYPNIINCDVAYTVSSPETLGVGRWLFSLSGTFTVQPRASKQMAWSAFVNILDRKWHYISQRMLREYGSSANPDRKRLIYRTRRVPVHLSITDNIYDRSISIQYVWTVTSSLDSIIRSGTMWHPLDRTQDQDRRFREWAASIGSIRQSRGHKGLLYNAELDSVISLCDINTYVSDFDWRNVGNRGTAPTIERRKRIQNTNTEEETDSRVLSAQQLLEVFEYNNRVAHFSLISPDKNDEPAGAVRPFNRQTTGNILSLAVKPYDAPGRSSPGDETGKTTKNPVTIQNRAKPSYWCRLSGRIVTVDKASDIPELVTLGGALCVQRDRWVQPYFVKKLLGHRNLYVTRYVIEYTLAEKPVGDLVRTMTGIGINFQDGGAM